MYSTSKQIVQDAWGIIGYSCTCDECHGKGTDWEEACLRCGGNGWYCDPVITEQDAIQACADAIEFFDKVKAASMDEQIAVGTDHWDRLEQACRNMAMYDWRKT